MKNYWSIVLLAALLTTGCVKQQIELTKENADKITSSTIVVVVAQEELEAVVEKSNVAGAMGGGLLPALIDVAIESSRSKSAEEVVSPLRAHLSEIDFRQELTSEISNQLNNSWLHVEKVESMSALTQTERKHLFDNRAGNAILLIDAEYKLSPDFMSLHTKANNEIYLKGAKEAIYKNKVEISSDNVVASSDEEAASAWSENDGVKLRAAIHDGIKQLASKIAKAITRPSKDVAVDESAVLRSN